MNIVSQSDSPIRAVFDVQRTAIKQGERALKQGIAAQQSVNKLALTSLKQQESLQRQSLELAHATTRAYLGITTSMMGVQDRRERSRTDVQQRNGQQTVDEAFARLKETHAEYFDVLERELNRGVESFDELSDNYVDALDQQTDQLFESYQTVEDQTAQNFDEVSQLLQDQLERSQEMQDQLEDQFEERTDRTKELLRRQTEAAEKFQQQLEMDVEQMQRQLEDSETEGRRRQSNAESSQLELVEGLGPTFHDRLNAAGIHTIDDLVHAGAETVAEAADVSEDRAEDWIEQASE